MWTYQQCKIKKRKESIATIVTKYEHSHELKSERTRTWSHQLSWVQIQVYLHTFRARATGRT